MEEHFTVIVNTSARWNSLCSLLDNDESWKLLSCELNIPIDSILVTITQHEPMHISPSREVLSRWGTDSNATVSKLLEILSTTKLNEARSLVQMWIIHSRQNQIHSIALTWNLSFLETTNKFSAIELYGEALLWYWKETHLKEAFVLFEKAAEFHYPLAFLRLYMISKRLNKPEEIQHKYSEQCKLQKDWFLHQTHTGDCIAQYHMGLYMDLIEKEEAQAMRWYELSAQQGYAPSQYNLAICYHDSSTKDPEKSILWYEKAAEQGYVRAQCNLGVCYENGDGVVTDGAKAAYWYRKAADQGDAEGACNLGWCYEYGKGVELDFKQAFEWYLKSAEKGHARGCFSVALCYDYERGVSKDIEKAFQWYRKGAELGDMKSQFNLGLCYSHGEGVKEDAIQASYWIKKAAEQGHERACRVLGCYFEFGKGVRRDCEKAIYWYQKSADKGYDQGQCNLAYCYYHGKGAKADHEKAAFWYQKAADQGLARAQMLLGSCYEFGEGVEQDWKKAMEWMKKASDLKHSTAVNKYRRMHQVYKIDRCPKDEVLVEEEEED